LSLEFQYLWRREERQKGSSRERERGRMAASGDGVVPVVVVEAFLATRVRSLEKNP
jgi:hypothetical protein